MFTLLVHWTIFNILISLFLDKLKKKQLKIKYLLLLTNGVKKLYLQKGGDWGGY